MKAMTQEIIAAAIAGDQDAAEKIYHSTLSQAQGMAFKIMRSYPNEQEDAVQEVMAHLFRQLPKFRGESAFSTWSHRVIHNHLLMQLRTRRGDRNPANCVEAVDSHPGDNEATGFHIVADERNAFAQVEAAIDVQRIMARMPRGYREALEQTALLGMTHEECAAAQKRTIGNSKSQANKARERAKEIADNMNDFDEVEPGYTVPGEPVSPTIAAPIVQAPKARKPVTKHCTCRPDCPAIFETLSYAAKYAPGHQPKPATKKTAPPPQPTAELAATPAATDNLDMLQINVPVRSLDKMFSMLPPELKKRALEAFLLEM